MKFSKYIIAALIAPLFASCSDDNLGPTIFPDVSDDADKNSYTYKLDTWLNQNFRDEYNVNFKYLMEDVEADMNYNLVPAKYENARDLALLVKYLWYDSYDELTGPDFIKTYGPRILHLVGSPAYNPNSGTETIGLAEGGLKVTLFKVNDMDLSDIDMMNEYYFRTMHHEFGHILHQTKSYPTEFNLLSTGQYDDSSWGQKQPGPVASKGFVTPYASSQAREDFAETIANFLTRSKDQMDLILWMAKQGWTTGNDIDEDKEEDDADYYCKYYLEDPTDPSSQKHYFFKSMERISGLCQMGMVGLGGEYLTSVKEVEDYLESLKEFYTVYDVEDRDKIKGDEMILQKQSIARNWFTDAWKLSFDELRNIVQKRQKSFNINELRKQLDEIQ